MMVWHCIAFERTEHGTTGGLQRYPIDGYDRLDETQRHTVYS